MNKLINNIVFQINILNKNIELAASFLKRCPSCLQNLVQHLCDFTCSDQQSDFIEVISSQKNNKTGQGRLFYKFIILSYKIFGSLFSKYIFYLFRIHY